MPRRIEPEPPPLKWIHRIRERQYKKTKGLPLEAWLLLPLSLAPRLSDASAKEELPLLLVLLLRDLAASEPSTKSL